ncbi:MAG: imidazolonepropionase [Planctomycetota bacterium]|jgi:imidazolonepropionase|nr:imidazolonepropionase [Planctomycetota bacterium]
MGNKCQMIVGNAGAVWGHQYADSVVIADGKIVAIGLHQELKAQWHPDQDIDAQGLLLAPGFVDGHTHPAFATGRAEEFDWRAEGADYLEIAKRGGGILSSVAHVRDASLEHMAAVCTLNFKRMLKHGTTTCEAKSGYGLDLESELKSLEAIRIGAERSSITVVPTFLGAHMIPLEHRDNPQDYVDKLCTEILPAVKQQGIAQAADIFIEEGAFNIEQARQYCEAAVDNGFKLRIHADQFNNLGGVELACEFGAQSVDHLEVLSDSGLECLAMSGKTHAGLLPTVPHFLRQKADAPARKIIKAGIQYFVGTDFNPGSSYTPSLPEAAHFARIRLRMSANEAMHGVTSGAAASLGLGDSKGKIEIGFDADLVFLNLPDFFHFGYSFGENPVAKVLLGSNL